MLIVSVLLSASVKRVNVSLNKGLMPDFFWLLILLVLLSASVERVSGSCMREVDASAESSGLNLQYYLSVFNQVLFLEKGRGKDIAKIIAN